jgi:hypothetical protein
MAVALSAVGCTALSQLPRPLGRGDGSEKQWRETTPKIQALLLPDAIEQCKGAVDLERYPYLDNVWQALERAHFNDCMKLYGWVYGYPVTPTTISPRSKPREGWGVLGFRVPIEGAVPASMKEIQ